LQKLDFHTSTGTALYPYTFSLNYEFVDTELGGDLLTFNENNEEDKKTENEFALCSRTFKNRRGEFRSPRNVFLHGRGGAKNLSCLYRFEANVGETVSVKKKFDNGNINIDYNSISDSYHTLQYFLWRE
jgi:hypothetical protein